MAGLVEQLVRFHFGEGVQWWTVFIISLPMAWLGSLVLAFRRKARDDIPCHQGETQEHGGLRKRWGD